ncbi:MAG: DUF2281 domain-containing protein [Microcystis aeruginosa W13-11]|nr:DUF2281 domain-containing protein [Microcystis aeruginosa W13-11]
MSVDDDIYKIVKSMPEDRANKILDFAKFLQAKPELEDKPLDFRDAAGLGQEMWQSIDVDAYIPQERSSWE